MSDSAKQLTGRTTGAPVRSGIGSILGTDNLFAAAMVASLRS